MDVTGTPNHTRQRFFDFSKMAAVAISNFQNLKFLTVGSIRRVELRYHAKLRGDRSTVADIWLFMAALRSRCGHYIFALWFLLLLLLTSFFLA